MSKVIHIDFNQDTTAEKPFSSSEASNMHSEILQEFHHDAVSENISFIDKEASKLDKQTNFMGRPQSYKTTRIYEFANIINDFGLKDRPLTRLIKCTKVSLLPNVAVIHGSQIKNTATSIILMGRNIFISHNDFSTWVKQQNCLEIEDKILSLLTEYIDNENQIPL